MKCTCVSTIKFAGQGIQTEQGSQTRFAPVTLTSTRWPWYMNMA